MIYVTFALKRLPALTRAQFQDYWFNTHAPLVRSVSAALHIRSYEQWHSLPADRSDVQRQVRGTAEDFDGMAVLGWHDFDDMAAPFQNEAGRAAAKRLLEDERSFIDHGRSAIWLSERVSIIPQSSA